ncbi:hypothetical protein [Aeromicrobium sp. CF3.5]|uniref:hypothetical protein n=1 Tax=Aeromicrobium sp. CF3.5 TaxID=3373078 RepID=UPI003EE78001
MTRDVRARWGVLVVPALLGSVLAACGGDTPGAGGGCTDASDELVADVRDRARQDFMNGDTRIAGLEVNEVMTTELSQDLQRFGADRLVAVRYDAFFAGEEGEDFPGVGVTGLFVADAEGIIGPVSESAVMFAYDKPEGADGYDAWATQVDDSPSGRAASECVSPY